MSSTDIQSMKLLGVLIFIVEACRAFAREDINTFLLYVLALVLLWLALTYLQRRLNP